MSWGADPAYGTFLNGTDYVTTWNFGYDNDGRMTKECLNAVTSGPMTERTLAKRTAQFDAAGRRTKQAFASDNRTGFLNLDTYQSYSYDSTKQRLTQIQRESDSAQKAQYSYDDTDGRMTKVTYGNGARAEYGYDASGAVTKVSHFSNGGTLIASVAYSYDVAGNVTQAVLDDSLTYPGDATITYNYDDQYRLVGESCAPAEGSYRQQYDYWYGYDGVGNRTYSVYYSYDPYSTSLSKNYYYDTRNQLTQVHSTVVWTDCYDTYYDESDVYPEYDQRGNLTKNGSVQFYWDSQDRLTKQAASGTVEYKYDLMGRRVAKRVNSGSWKWYSYDGLQVLAEGTGTSDKTYYTTNGGAIGGIISRDNNGTKYWYHYDRLGSVMAITDSNGNPYAVYTMEAFGDVRQRGTSTGYANEHTTIPQPYQLTTKEYDADIGLYYFNARWYDPTTGRFVSKEPISFVPKYSYCDDNPVSYVDKDGKVTKKPLTPQEMDAWAKANGVECSLSNIIGKMSDKGCSAVLAGLKAYKSFDMILALLLRWESPPIQDYDDLRRRAPGIEMGGIPYFFPACPYNDLCTALCTCLHEYIHVLDRAAGIPSTEFIPGIAGGLCETGLSLALLSGGIL